MAHYMTSAAIIIASLFLFALGLTAITIIADAQVTIRSLPYPDFEGTGWSTIWRRTTNMHEWISGPNYSILVAGVFAMMTGLFGFFLICSSHAITVVFAAIFGGCTTITSLAALVFSMITFRAYDKGNNSTPTRTSRSVEGWACSNTGAEGANGVKFSKVCVESVRFEFVSTIRGLYQLRLLQSTGRWLTCFLFVFSILFLMSVNLSLVQNARHRHKKVPGQAGRTSSKVSKGSVSPLIKTVP
ncbi:hypothetical protein B0J14DRAFT_594399 [Halenospora varia]|nr:hypothetical protein B0J14DRAFT_594399 [Halenospora varia]